MPRRTDISKILIIGSGLLALAATAPACSIVEIPVDVGATLVGTVPVRFALEGRAVTVSICRVKEGPAASVQSGSKSPLVQQVNTTRGGTFQIERLSPGLYSLVVGEGAPEQVVMFLRVKHETGKTDLTPEIKKILKQRREQEEIRRKARVQKRVKELFGIVVDRTGAVVPSAQVVLALRDSEKEIARASTDELGRFSFAPEAGRYDLRITMPGFYTADIPLELAPQGPTDFDHGTGVELEVGACEQRIHPYRLYDLRKECPAKPCPVALTSRKS